MNIFRWIKRRFAIWMFVRGIGKLSAQYSELSQQIERAAFGMESFGKEWLEVQAAQQLRQADAAPANESKK